MLKRIAIWGTGLCVTLIAVMVLGLYVSRDTRPNVLILVWDTVRADHLSLHGYERPTSPALDAFAEDAVVFENAVAPSMWTVPSHASMFTGQPPSAHGANTWWWQDDAPLTLAEWFAEQGYITWAFSSNPNLAQSPKRLLQGYQTVHHSFRGKYRKPSRQATERKLIPRDESSPISPSFEGKALASWGYNAGPVARKVFKRFARRARFRRKPWLAFINLMEAHSPRVPTMESRTRVIGDEALIEKGLSVQLTTPDEFGYIAGTVSYTPEELAAITAVYDAAIGDLDKVTGEILDDLDELGVLENTIVVIVGDHGEALGEHQLLSHRYGLFEEIVRVPLVIAWKGTLAPKRVQEPVSPTTLFGTLLSLTGTEAPPEDHPMDRGSLLDPAPAQIHAQLVQTDRPGFVVQFQDQPEVDIEPYLSPIRVVREGRYKYLRYDDGRRELYDLERDPEELHPLEDPARKAVMDAMLDSYEQSYPIAPIVEAPEGADQDQLDLLKALGYVQ